MMLDYLNQSWFSSLLTIITFIIALILAIYFFIKSRNLKKISLYSEYDSILDEKPSVLSDSVDIFFQGKKIERLNKTKIYFWNSGNQTIYKKDIENIDPPKLYANEKVDILQLNIINKTREVINPRLSLDMGSNFLMFDFLDPKDGLVMEILHTGKQEDIKFEGTIIGVKSKLSLNKKSSKINNFIKGLVLSSNNIIFPFFDKIFGLIAVLMGLLVFLLGLSVIFGLNVISSNNSVTEGMIISSVGLFYFFIGLLIHALLKEPYPKKLKV